MNANHTEYPLLKIDITVLYIILKVLPSLTSSKVTMIHHNSMPDKDHKEAALKAQELKAGTITVHEMPAAMPSTANGPQLE